jgi:hypothetical protein
LYTLTERSSAPDRQKRPFWRKMVGTAVDDATTGEPIGSNEFESNDAESLDLPARIESKGIES